MEPLFTSVIGKKSLNLPKVEIQPFLCCLLRFILLLFLNLISREEIQHNLNATRPLQQKISYFLLLLLIQAISCFFAASQD